MEGFLKNLGERIRGIRKASRLSQAQLAEKAGLHTTYVSDVERGEARKVSAEVLYAIAQALGVRLADLVADVDSNPELQELLGECLGGLRQLDRQRQQAVLNVLKALLAEIGGMQSPTGIA